MTTIRTLLLILSTACLSSCATLTYYGQSIAGHLDILRRQQPIESLIADAATPRDLATALREVLEIRRFASESLLLPDNDSYRNYVSLDREYVVWNVVAAPEFAVEPHRWCFLIVGCLPYRGYFDRAAALAFADGLRERNFDVFTGGVTAYSTLGWFADPVLSSMLARGRIQLARIIFHELAHQKIYLQDDTDFNEAFADTVARIGVRKWLRSRGEQEALVTFERQLQRERQFTALVEAYRDKFAALYAQPLSDSQKRLRKTRLHEAMQTAYQALQSEWDGHHNEYDTWFTGGPNNARMATILTYRDLEPGFSALYQTLDENLEAFYESVRKLGTCQVAERKRFLEQANGLPECG